MASVFTKFILNNQSIQTDLPVGTTLLDFIRYHQHLSGTKIGCREGDCGACTILVGELKNGMVNYQSMTSCLMPLQNAIGKHIVTVEGINQSELTPVQQMIVEAGGTQCGFCTIGFVMSLTGFVMDDMPANTENAIAAIDGNICRCTGYKSLERAADSIASLKKSQSKKDKLKGLIQQGFLPEYFNTIKDRLAELQTPTSEQIVNQKNEAIKIVGGGTDLYVQQPEAMVHQAMESLLNRNDLKTIEQKADHIYIGAAATAQDVRASEIMLSLFPNLKAHMKLVSSTPIRNMATLGGNFVNASPIGDMTIFFLALDAHLILNQSGNQRTLKLRHFYKGYKQIDLLPGEFIETIFFKKPTASDAFNFEKVCKRTHLDIASVNTACLITTKADTIIAAHLAAGGLAPIPKYLEQTSQYLVGKKINAETVLAAAKMIQEEVAPISDARGSAAYKRLLLRQLFFAHFLQLFPKQIQLRSLLSQA